MVTLPKLGFDGCLRIFSNRFLYSGVAGSIRLLRSRFILANNEMVVKG